MMLNIMPGSGRVFRSRRYIAFLAEHEIELLTLISMSPDNLWEQVELLSRTASASPTPVVVLDLSANRYFRAGSVALKIDGNAIESAIESGLFEPTSLIECGNCATAATVADTFLSYGYVAADGFLLRPTAPIPSSSSTDQAHEVGNAAAEPGAWLSLEGPAAEIAPVSNAAGSSTIFDDPAIDLVDIGRGQPRAVHAVDELAGARLEAETAGGLAGARLEAETAGGLAGARLEAETADETIEIVETSAGVTPMSTAETETVAGAAEPPMAQTGWNFREPGEPLIVSEHAGAGSAAAHPPDSASQGREPQGGQRQGGQQQGGQQQGGQQQGGQRQGGQQQGGQRQGGQRDLTAPRSALLDVAGAGVSHVPVGALIGRYPDKHPVPDGYLAIQVSGSDISRVHLEVWVDTAGFLRARDCGSANGATVTRDGGTMHDLPITERGLELAVGDRLDFGSGSARFIGWGRDG